MVMAKTKYSFAKSLIVIALVLMSVAVVASAQENLQAWENYEFAKQSIKPAQVTNLSLEDLKFLRGIVFGKHGRIFKDAEIKSYLEGQPWYKAAAGFQNSMLNDTERRNLDVIRDAEAGKHPEVQPGDMRFYRNRVLTAKKLGHHSGAEWTVLAAEIEAIRGKRFDETPWLQTYFDERYWYKAADHYDPKELTAIERQNLQAIIGAHKKQRRVALSPGDM